MFSNNKYLAMICLVHFQPIIVLTGPMLYFYVRGVLKDDSQLYKKDWIHFVPSILYFINVSKFYFYSIDKKLAFAERVIEHREIMLNFDPVLFSGNIAYLVRSVLVISYTSAAAYLVFKHFKNDNARHKQDTLMLKWLTAFLGFNYIMNFGIFYYVGQLLYNWSFNGGITVIPWGAFLFGIIALIVLNLLLFFFPRILYGLPQLDYNLKNVSKVELIPNEVSTKQEQDYGISEERIELLKTKISKYCENHPYINPNFSLPSMSFETGIPVHHISYYFNVVLNTNFSLWKNGLRIKYVMDLMKTESAEILTLDAISKKAGFVSRNTFIASFKQHTGLTPSEYLNSL
jgi:AraC-like DNA-binding protein